jgi:hypothetical protein
VQIAILTDRHHATSIQTQPRSHQDHMRATDSSDHTLSQAADYGKQHIHGHNRNKVYSVFPQRTHHYVNTCEHTCCPKPSSKCCTTSFPKLTSVASSVASVLSSFIHNNLSATGTSVGTLMQVQVAACHMSRFQKLEFCFTHLLRSFHPTQSLAPNFMLDTFELKPGHSQMQRYHSRTKRQGTSKHPWVA